MYYPPILIVHSWLRWATLLLALGATLNAFRPDPDLTKRMPGRQWDTLFMMALDFQVLFGLLLYFGLSPFTMQAFKDFGGAIQNAGLRFWAIDHIGWMAAATVLVRVGRVLALGAATAQARRKWRLIFFGLTTTAILVGIPWPGMNSGRPLFRWW